MERHEVLGNPTGYVVPLIQAGMNREGRPRAQAPEVALLADCIKRFDVVGLQRLVMDLACAAGEATTMLSELSMLDQVEILQAFSAQHTVEMAFDGSLKPGDVLWAYVPATLRPFFAPDAKPSQAEVLFEIDRKYGFAASMDFIVILANYTSAVLCHVSRVIGRSTEEMIQLLEGRVKPAWAELDAHDGHAYTTPQC
ncbi:hypothetical protein [Streptomyces sp. NBC_00454]|uniref:hypothetical protein n=1 Tax=Streptomyces sp. NBC_00454 TaxID=2975747 RepID=UPI0030E5B627